MTAKQATYVAIPSILTLVLLVAVGFLLASGGSGLNAGRDASLPEFSIVERNMVLDNAVISVKTDAQRPYQVRAIAKYVIDSHVEQRRSSASIYFYSNDKQLSRDEPDHKMTWRQQGGFVSEY